MKNTTNPRQVLKSNLIILSGNYNIPMGEDINLENGENAMVCNLLHCYFDGSAEQYFMSMFITGNYLFCKVSMRQSKLSCNQDFKFLVANLIRLEQ